MVTGCKGPDGKFKLPGGDARKTPADPKLRVQQNIREGRGIRFNDPQFNIEWPMEVTEISLKDLELKDFNLSK